MDVEEPRLWVFGGMGPSCSVADIILETFNSEACEQITKMTRPLGYNYFLSTGKTSNDQVTELQPRDPKHQTETNC